MLCSKYRRTLEIKSTYAALRQSMQELSVQSCDEFETWRAKEKAHLRSLSKEPEQETLEMEYFQKLVNLRDTKYVLLLFNCPLLSDTRKQGARYRHSWGGVALCPR